MPSVIAFGRINGAAQPAIGPTNFSPDWGGVFTALEVAEFLEKITLPSEHQLENVAEIAGNFITAQPSAPGSFAEKVSDVKLEQLLTNLEYLLLDIEHIQISADTTRFLRGTQSQCQFIRLESTQGRRPQELLAETLLDMGLSGWGYLYQIALALAKFERSAPQDTGHRCMSVFFTV